MRRYLIYSIFLLIASVSARGQQQKIVVNGIEMNEVQIREFIRIYKQPPKPGNYWYDSVSGLYGVVNYPAYGFLYAGYSIGKLDPHCSRGNTGLFINGREIPQQEKRVWTDLLGYEILPGRYWLDGRGNAGYEGSPVVVINLYEAARISAYRNTYAGDHFWSARFSAGNYNQGNTQGYVSVPGYGPVGYGFD